MDKGREEIRWVVLIFFAVIVLTFFGIGISSALAENQELNISPINSNQGHGGNFKISVNYNVSDSDNTLTGLGINIHFDSSKLNYISYENFLDKGDLKSPPALMNDTSDEDNDPDTDKMINMSWVSFSGQWPNENLPVALAELNFTVTQDAELGATTINISVFEHDSGYGTSLSQGTIAILDLTNDPDNCGTVGSICEYNHAEDLCVNGECSMGACEAGYYNLNNNPDDGCEYACTISNDGIEVCDGMDNDCDGTVDEGFDDDDGDGIIYTDEQGPEGTNPNYDGNEDGIPDKDQSEAASFYTFDSYAYVTLASSTGELAAVQAVSNPSPDNTPEGATFPYGFFSFTLELESGVTAAIVTLYLPQGAPPSYYKFGPTPDDSNPHWYEFSYDHVTQTGAQISGNEIRLYFVDGLRGDDDCHANGFIVDPGGPGLGGGITTLIELDQFKALPEGDHITIIWNTLSELETLGFHLWRSEDETTGYSKITPYLIMAEGDVISPAEYCFIDDVVLPGVTYYYKLEEVETKELSNFHGPVSAAIIPGDANAASNKGSSGGGCFISFLKTP